jgi:outer membrane protein OmpA-like peptidoglycan-associated protein
MIRTPARQSAAVVLLMRTLLLLASLSLLGGAASAQSQPPKGPPQTFIVYFHSGSTKLTPIDLQTVARAAAAVTQAKAQGIFSHVKVIGYSDSRGSINTAQHVSEQRAFAVRDALVHAGVPRQEIGTEGRGKLEPAVPASDQVNQPRNRRVRIIIYRPGD